MSRRGRVNTRGDCRNDLSKHRSRNKRVTKHRNGDRACDRVPTPGVGDKGNGGPVKGKGKWN